MMPSRDAVQRRKWWARLDRMLFPYFQIAWLMIGLVSLYDMYLVWRHRAVILTVERNPICEWSCSRTFKSFASSTYTDRMPGSRASSNVPRPKGSSAVSTHQPSSAFPIVRTCLGDGGGGKRYRSV